MFASFMTSPWIHLFVRLGAVVALACGLCAQEAPSTRVTNRLAASGFPFRQVGSGIFELGRVVLDQRQRTLSFPAVINQREGTVEYALVTSRGKTHESVFKTDAEPEHIHLAMLLLGAKTSSSNTLPADPSQPMLGEPVNLTVAWQTSGLEQSRPIEDFIVTTNNNQRLRHGTWTYNGSRIREGRFLAQLDGSIISIHIDSDALINNPRPGRENDDLHQVNSKALPPEGASLRIVIKLEPRSHRPVSEHAAPPTRP